MAVDSPYPPDLDGVDDGRGVWQLRLVEAALSPRATGLASIALDYSTWSIQCRTWRSPSPHLQRTRVFRLVVQAGLALDLRRSVSSCFYPSPSSAKGRLTERQRPVGMGIETVRAGHRSGGERWLGQGEVPARSPEHLLHPHLHRSTVDSFRARGTLGVAAAWHNRCQQVEALDVRRSANSGFSPFPSSARGRLWGRLWSAKPAAEHVLHPHLYLHRSLDLLHARRTLAAAAWRAHSQETSVEIGRCVHDATAWWTGKAGTVRVCVYEPCAI